MEFQNKNDKIIQNTNQLNICCLCLIKDSTFINLLNENDLKNKLIQLFNIEIEILPKINYPWQICIECCEKTDMFSKFYNQVKENQITLTSLIYDLTNNAKINEIETKIVTNVLVPEVNNLIKKNVIEKITTNNWEGNQERFDDKSFSILPTTEVDEDEKTHHLLSSEIIYFENIYEKILPDDDYDEDDDKPLIERISIDKIKKEKNLEKEENQLTDNEDDDDDSDCKLSKIKCRVRKMRNKRNLNDSTLILENDIKNQSEKADYDIDDDQDTNLTSQNKFKKHITHRIRLDAPIREFFDLKCTKCDNKTFLTFTKLKKHMELHKETCYVTCCNRKLYRREAIMEHITYHLNPKQFVCKECGQNCKSKTTLKMHMKQHIPIDEREFHCTQCSQGFVLKSQLLSHEKSHYTNDQKKFVCEECGKAFAFKFVLEKHKQHMHIREKNYMCEICARSFVDKVNLTAHKRTHDLNIPRLQCPYCDSRLKNKVTLKIHMRVHNPTVHTCYLCHKELATRNALQTHVQFVHGEKKHKCSICEKSFKKALTLKEHMSIHTGEVLYKCKFCIKTFNAKANYYSHIKKFHNTEWAEGKRLKSLNGS